MFRTICRLFSVHKLFPTGHNSSQLTSLINFILYISHALSLSHSLTLFHFSFLYFSSFKQNFHLFFPFPSILFHFIWISIEQERKHERGDWEWETFRWDKRKKWTFYEEMREERVGEREGRGGKHYCLALEIEFAKHIKVSNGKLFRHWRSTDSKSYVSADSPEEKRALGGWEWQGRMFIFIFVWI